MFIERSDDELFEDQGLEACYDQTRVYTCKIWADISFISTNHRIKGGQTFEEPQRSFIPMTFFPENESEDQGSKRYAKGHSVDKQLSLKSDKGSNKSNVYSIAMETEDRSLNWGNWKLLHCITAHVIQVNLLLV